MQKFLKKKPENIRALKIITLYNLLSSKHGLLLFLVAKSCRFDQKTGSRQTID
jgi:hypothetical protein